MKYNSFIGVDISKLWVDISLITIEGEVVDLKCENTVPTLKKVFTKLFDSNDLLRENVLICAEYTGHYTNPLKVFCLQNDYNLWLESGAEIKLRSGVVRSKNDKVDALRIAEYAKRYIDKVKLQTIDDESLEELCFMSSERDMYIKERAKYKAQLKDLPGYINPKLFIARKKRFKKQIRSLSKVISQLDGYIQQLINKSDVLIRQFKQLQSIQGVGPKVALETIIATKGFKKFDNGRKYCCHIGVAPFSYQSGSSQRSKNKVSHRANKKLKTLYHMAALSAIHTNGEFKVYFERKVKEGKNKMTVLNAVRAKIVHRMFALIRDNREYEIFYTDSLA